MSISRRVRVPGYISLLALAGGSPALAQEVRGADGPSNTGGDISLPHESRAPTSGANRPSGELEEIVVTARKVEENLQSVPVAVTAFTGAALQQQNAVTVRDVASLTPGLVIREASSTGSAATFQIRGQFQNDVLATLDPSVGTYVDGYYWARAYGINADLLDIQSVQTLKGPQGTLFGRNTTGGAMLIQTNDPDFRGLSGLISGTYGRFDYTSGTAILNAPIIDDKVALRIAYQKIDSDGYVRDANHVGTNGDRGSWTGRAKLFVKPTDNLSVLLSAELFKTDYRNNPLRLQYVEPTSFSNVEAGLETLGLGCLGATGPTAACFGTGATGISGAIAAANRDDSVALNVVPRVYAKTQTYTATATLDTYFGAIKFIGGYRTITALADVDLDGGPYQQLATRGFQNLSQFSGEVQITGKALDNAVDFAGGAFYFSERGSDRSYSAALVALQSVGRGVPAYLNFLATGDSPITNTQGQIRTRSQGLYGQATYHITDKLAFTGGLRYSVEDKAIAINNGALISGTFAGPATGAVFVCQLDQCPSYRSDDFSGVSYTAGFDYKITPDALLYVKTAKGFRSGGQNLRATNAIPGVASFTPFQPEQATSYEGGLKSEYFDRRVRLNLAAYYTQVDNIQRSTLVTTLAGATATVLGNAGKVDIYGAEAELDALLFPGFRLGGTAAYTRPEYKNYIDPITGFDRSRERFDNVPEWKLTASGTYTHAFDFGRLTLRGDYIWQSKTPLGTFNYYTDAAGVSRDATTGATINPAVGDAIINATTMEAVGLVNARASVALLDDTFELAIFGRNLTDNRGKVTALVVGGVSVAAQRREPRTWGLTGTFRFGR